MGIGIRFMTGKRERSTIARSALERKRPQHTHRKSTMDGDHGEAIELRIPFALGPFHASIHSCKK
jgi:hypothetical protein